MAPSRVAPAHDDPAHQSPERAQHPLRVVVLASGSGTLLQALLDACADHELDAEIVAVGSDRPAIAALQRAERFGVPTFVLPLARGARLDSPERARWDADLAEQVAAYEPDLVVLAGFMKLLGAPFLARFGGRLINSHPALLPSFPGAHGVRDALAHGVKVTGCTVFVVDEGVDTGRILAQEAVRVLSGDTEDSLHERIKVVERQILVETVRTWPRDLRADAAAPARQELPAETLSHTDPNPVKVNP